MGSNIINQLCILLKEKACTRMFFYKKARQHLTFLSHFLVAVTLKSKLICQVAKQGRNKLFRQDVTIFLLLA